jgi:hypothetical protein
LPSARHYTVRRGSGSAGRLSPPRAGTSVHPTALRLKELETLEKVTEKIDKISVFGGLEGVLKDRVKIRP